MIWDRGNFALLLAQYRRDMISLERLVEIVPILILIEIYRLSIQLL